MTYNPILAPWASVPMSGLEEGRGQGVDLISGALDPCELISLMPAVTPRTARNALEVLAADFC